ncbi:MAG: aspartate aminotransferase family protein [Desulfovibrionaceae bacterium]
MNIEQFALPVDKNAVLEDCKKYWNPGKTQDWQDMGVDLVIGRREGYFLYDVSGKRLMDLHLNGGTYNLGHRNPEVIQALKDGLETFDIGNHHFPSIGRAELAKALVACTPENLTKAVFASGGGEAIDIALKSARNATGRKKIISLIRCYHGHTGLAVATGDGRFSKRFLSDGDPNTFVQVPFNDLDAMEKALAPGDAACVILETIPATYGFPMPEEGYLPAVKAMCEKHGTLYIADEVQTGLGRCGTLWGITGYGVTPDILVTSKGLSGGIYPIGAVALSEQAGKWLYEDGWAHMSTFGGAELGCKVACKVLEISQRQATVDNVNWLAGYVREGLEKIMGETGGFFNEIRQRGVIFGLGFDHPEGAKYVMRALYEHGVWAIFSALDPRILQFKVGLLCDKPFIDELLERVAVSLLQAKDAIPA